MARSLISRSLVTGARMSIATGVTMLLASALHRGSPWAGFNAMTNAVGIGGRRPKARFDGARTLLGLGTLVGGSAVTAAMYEAALARMPRRRGLASGMLTALAGYAIDRFVLPSAVVPSFVRTLGPGGTLAKYTALGLAAASRR
jgi:hypothetical protein